MALYVIVVSAQAVGRNQFDAKMTSSIVEIVNLGRPVLICVNMMCEKMHWWKTAEATGRACKAIKDSIVSKADRDHGPITVFMTECLFFDDFQEQMQARQVKTVEDVSSQQCFVFDVGLALSQGPIQVGFGEMPGTSALFVDACYIRCIALMT